MYVQNNVLITKVIVLVPKEITDWRSLHHFTLVIKANDEVNILHPTLRFD